MGSPQGFGISPSASGMYSPGGPGAGVPPSSDSHSNNPTTGASWAPSGGWLSQSPHSHGHGGGVAVVARGTGERGPTASNLLTVVVMGKGAAKATEAARAAAMWVAATRLD